MPQTDLVHAEKIIERIKNTCAKIEGELILPSISLGCSTKMNMEQKTGDLLKEAEDKMYYNKMTEKRFVNGKMITSLEKQYLRRIYEDKNHIVRFQGLVNQFKTALDLTDREQADLNLLALYHNIGLVAISEDILRKPGPLTPDEWTEIKKHPEIGYHIAVSSEEIKHISDDILAHHERWDGAGYPHQLRKTEIPKLARIHAIIDSFVVMTGPRPYKQQMTRAEALHEIKTCAGTQFDPDLAERIVKAIEG